MKIHSIDNSTNFKNKCRIQGSVANLREISGNIAKSGTEARIFHPSGMVYLKQPYADAVIVNGNDIKNVDEFLNTGKVFSCEFGTFGTEERSNNIIKSLWGNEEIKTLEAENVMAAMKNNKFDYHTLDIQS